MTLPDKASIFTHVHAGEPIAIGRPDFGAQQTQRHGDQPVIEMGQYDIIASLRAGVVEDDGPLKMCIGVFQPLFARRPASPQRGNVVDINGRASVVWAVGIAQHSRLERRLLSQCKGYDDSRLDMVRPWSVETPAWSLSPSAPCSWETTATRADFVMESVPPGICQT